MPEKKSHPSSDFTGAFPEQAEPFHQQHRLQLPEKPVKTDSEKIDILSARNSSKTIKRQVDSQSDIQISQPKRLLQTGTQPKRVPDDDHANLLRQMELDSSISKQTPLSQAAQSRQNVQRVIY